MFWVNTWLIVFLDSNLVWQLTSKGRCAAHWSLFFLPTWNQLALVPLLAKGFEKQDKPDPESAQRGF